MVNQKLISFKINEDLLPGLDQLCSQYGMKRNAMLNLLVSFAVDNFSGELFKFYSLCALQQGLPYLSD